MLVLTRKPGQAVIIDLAEGLDPRTPVGELFAQGPIEILISTVRGDSVRLGLIADPRFRILRDELLAEPSAAYEAAAAR